MDLVDPVERLLLAAALGAALGFEREWNHHTAGLRTNTLIALGSALFTVVAIRMTEAHGGDAARIPAQVVTGIGFLGGGAILRSAQSGGDVRGMTTAAAIWVNAAIGMAAGAGFFLLATLSTAATLIVLVALMPVDRVLAAHRRRKKQARNGRKRPPAPSGPPDSPSA